VSETRSAADIIVRHLEREGVTHIFGIPGGPLMPLYEAVFDRGVIKPIITRHEQGAAFMADGYARVSGRLGVCCATTGPGATNALTGIACSQADSVPVLLLTAQIATAMFGKGAAQESSLYGLDIVSLYRSVTKQSLMLVNPQLAGEAVRSSIRAAMSGRRGTAHLNMPADLMKRRIREDVVEPELYRVGARPFDREAVREAARRLARAKRPALLLGHGVALSGAFEAARRLAERLMIPVATTPKAKGVFPEDHLLSLGVFGFAGCPQAEKYLLSGEVDVLVTVGTSLGENATNAWDPKFAPSSALIQIDCDAREIGKNYPSTIPVIGDAAAVLTELLFQVERELRWKDESAAVGRDEAWVREIKSRAPRYHDAELMSSDSEPILPQRLMQELRQALPDDAIVFTDIGNVMAWVLHYFPIYTPGTFHVNLGWASMGHAGAAAIGGKLAAPNKTVVAIQGDGAFAMNGMELHTAVENKISMFWIVLNNGGHGMVHHGERAQFGGKFSTAKFNRPLDVAGMARAMGARACVVEKPGELATALRQSAGVPGPVVIDARVDIEALPPLGMRIETLNRFFASEAAVK
jgi:acetolactate synthase-1/2/3 large subunit